MFDYFLLKYLRYFFLCSGAQLLYSTTSVACNTPYIPRTYICDIFVMTQEKLEKIPRKDDKKVDGKRKDKDHPPTKVRQVRFG